MTPFNYPKKAAYAIAQSMKKFRAKTENTAYSEYNFKADEDRMEVVRQINWGAFNEIVEQLEFCYNQLPAFKKRSNPRA